MRRLESIWSPTDPIMNWRPPDEIMLLLCAASVALSGLTLFAGEPAISLEALGSDGFPLTLSSVVPSVAGALRRRRGRPRKFAAPSRAVTLTLPESVIASLAAIDRDLSRAIVGLAKRRAPKNGHPPADLAVFGRRAVITIQPTSSLERRIGIDLVPLPDGRALISFDQPTTIADLELLLFDALEDPALSADDRKVFEGIGAILRDARRSEDVDLLHRSIIVLESTSSRRRKTAKTAT
jgi:hypothetical protein